MSDIQKPLQPPPRGTAIGGSGWTLIGAIMLLGGLAFLATVAHGVLSGSAALVRVSAPGETALRLERAGNYTLFLEYPRTDDSRGHLKPAGVEQLDIVLSADDGTSMPLAPAGAERYAIRRVMGEGLFRLTVPTAGSFTLRAGYPPGFHGTPVELVFKRNYREHVLQSLLRGSLILLMTGLLVAAAAYRFSARSRVRADVEFRL